MIPIANVMYRGRKRRTCFTTDFWWTKQIRYTCQKQLLLLCRHCERTVTLTVTRGGNR